MLDFVTRPLRAILGETEHDVVDTMRETRDIESNMLGAIEAIEHATESLEHHVEVIETLATSVDPLRASVDRLTDTMQDLVAMLAPVAGAERDVQRVGRLFHRHRHEESQPSEDQAGP